MALPALRTAARRIAGPSYAPTARAISTTAPVLASKKTKPKKKAKYVNPHALPINEAVRILRAFEIANPSSSYTLELKTKDQKVLLRGRVQLPSDPRRTQDVIVVFADAGTPSEEAAREGGATVIGGQELFPKILSGEVVPTKVLCTPQLLPNVTRTLARFLGPKNLMPTVKRGTVGEGAELTQLVQDAGGAIDWRADKEGMIRSLVGRASFPADSVQKNIEFFLNNVTETARKNLGDSEDALERAAKTTVVTRVRLETTNGPMLEINTRA